MFMGKIVYTEAEFYKVDAEIREYLSEYKACIDQPTANLPLTMPSSGRMISHLTIHKRKQMNIPRMKSDSESEVIKLTIKKIIYS